MKESLLLLKDLLKLIKSYRCMTAVSKNVYFDILDDIVNKFNNQYQRTTKMKPMNVKSDFYAEYNNDSNEKDPKFKVSYHVRTSKHKNIFTKGYVPIWSEEGFVIRGLENTVSWTYVVSDLNGEKTGGTFYEKELQKTNQEELKIEKVIKRKGNKLYVKCQGYENWIG